MWVSLKRPIYALHLSYLRHRHLKDRLVFTVMLMNLACCYRTFPILLLFLHFFPDCKIVYKPCKSVQSSAYRETLFCAINGEQTVRNSLRGFRTRRIGAAARRPPQSTRRRIRTASRMRRKADNVTRNPYSRPTRLGRRKIGDLSLFAKPTQAKTSR